MLWKAGLPKSTSDMSYRDYQWEFNDDMSIKEGTLRPQDTRPWVGNDWGDHPCWSIGALLEIIPFSTQTTTGYKKARVDIIYKKGFKGSVHTEEAETLIEALVQTVKWLLDNKYLKFEEKPSIGIIKADWITPDWKSNED